MKNRITYNISISCDVNEYGAVIPTGSSADILDENGEYLNMSKYPETVKIMAIWIGEYYKYPKIDETNSKRSI